MNNIKGFLLGLFGSIALLLLVDTCSKVYAQEIFTDGKWTIITEDDVYVVELNGVVVKLYDCVPDYGDTLETRFFCEVGMGYPHE